MAEQYLDADLLKKSRRQLRLTYYDLIDRIRYHRDQKGNDRCWADDLHLYELLPERQNDYTFTNMEERFNKKCSSFRMLRGGIMLYEIPGTQGVAVDHDRIEVMSRRDMEINIIKLRKAVRAHMSVEVKTKEHDRTLYTAIAERAMVDVRLPDEREHVQKCSEFRLTVAGKPLSTVYSKAPC